MPNPTTILANCTAAWGNSTIIWSDPIITTVNNAIVLPVVPTIDMTQYRNWGVFDSEGNVVDGAALFRGPGMNRLGQKPKLDVEDGGATDFAPANCYIYGGPFSSHFGHWLLTSLARFWPAKSTQYRSLPILCHSDCDPSVWFERPYIRAIMGALSITPDAFAWFQNPVKVRRLIVPHPSFIEQHCAHRAYSELCRRIGEVLLRNHPPEDGPLQPVYLSKAKVKRGVARIANEDELTSALAKQGVQIIFPEEMTFAEQVGLFASKRTIFGLAGSSFHVSAFAPPRSRNVCLTPSGDVNSNIVMIDKLNANDSHYLFPTGMVENMGRDSAFGANFRLERPAEIADGLLSLA
jgi:capsular polysaccharide biosynthesis protein